MSLAILPFRNASGDPSLDWLGPSLADMLSTDVGQSASLRTVSQDRLHQVFSDLRIAPNASIEPATLRSLAEFSNADTLVSGQYAKFGGQIRIDATLQDLKHDRTVPIKIDAVDEKDIPGAVDRLAAIDSRQPRNLIRCDQRTESEFVPAQLPFCARAARLQPGDSIPAGRQESRRGESTAGCNQGRRRTSLSHIRASRKRTPRWDTMAMPNRPRARPIELSQLSARGEIPDRGRRTPES